MKKTVLIFLCAALCCVLSFSTYCAQPASGDEAATQQSASVVDDRPWGDITSLSFVKSAVTSVTLSWDAVDDAYGYRIFYSIDGGKTYRYSSMTRSNKVTVHNLRSQYEYKFKVLAFKYVGGEAVFGDFSEAVTAYTIPATVEKIYTKSISDSSVTLAWNKCKGATGYKVFVFDGEKYNYYKATEKNTVTVEGLQKNTWYSFKIQSCNKRESGIAYGAYSEVYSESTDCAGSPPQTKAQAAQLYNNLINELKSRQKLKLKYKKTVETEFISCSKQNLSNTVKNTLNLFSGTLSKTYTFKNGTDGTTTPMKLLEPCGKNAGLLRENINKFTVKEEKNTLTVKIQMKSYEKSSASQTGAFSFSGFLSVPDYAKLNTKPLKIGETKSYYDNGFITMKLTDGKLTAVKIEAAAIADIAFSVSTVKANALIGYGITQTYVIL